MFASSPALSAMDHPVYDVWVIDCLGKDPEELPKEEIPTDKALPDEGTIPEGSVAQPEETPDQQEQGEPRTVPGKKDEPSPPPEEESPAEPQPTQPDPKPEDPVTEAAPQQERGDNFNGIY